MSRRARKSAVNENIAMPISLARGRLFELAEDVLTRRTDRVAISHKDYDEQLVLIRSSDLAKMEDNLEVLRKGVDRKPFSLRGIATLSADADEILAQIRREQAERWEAKLASFSAPLEADEMDE